MSDTTKLLDELLEDLKYIQYQSTYSNQAVGIEDENYFAWIRERSKLALKKARKVRKLVSSPTPPHDQS